MSEREGRKFFFASGVPSGVVPHRWRRPCHRSCVRWVRHWAHHCYGDGQWARLSALYFGGAVRCDSDAFAAVKPVTRDPGHGMMSPIGTKVTSQLYSATSAFRGDCVVKLGRICRRGFSVSFDAALFVPASEAAAAARPQLQMMRQLRRTSCRQWRWMAQELGETAQVLRGRGEQHFVPGAAQAPQSKPVKPQDALHMRKSHLDLLALAA